MTLQEFASTQRDRLPFFSSMNPGIASRSSDHYSSGQDAHLGPKNEKTAATIAVIQTTIASLGKENITSPPPKNLSVRFQSRRSELDWFCAFGSREGT
jgi:hypothetical protein